MIISYDIAFIMDISITSNISLNSEQLSFNISGEENENFIETDRDLLIKKLMQLYSKHNLSKVAIEDIAKLVNSVPGAKIQIPTTKHLIFQEFSKNSSNIVNKHILCPRCKDYSRFAYANCVDPKCTSCENDLSKSDFFFVHISIETQLKKIVQYNFDDITAYRQKVSTKKCENICDVYDGQVLKNMRTFNFIYSITLNTDGLIMHNSSKSSLYPVLMICNFLPPQIRFKEKNIIVAGLYYGIAKPDFSKYFDPIIREMEKLSEIGFFYRNEVFQFIVSHASFDLPMKSVMQNIRQYNGYNACYYCEHPGEKTQTGVRYVNTLQPFALRNHKNMILMTAKAIKTGNVINGVKGISPMIGFKNFDIVQSLSVDYMHGVLLGVTKNLLSFWIDSIHNQKLFYIKPKQRIIVNKRLQELKLCRFINRNITSLDTYSTFKASQYRTFLLYLFPVLQDILQKKYFNHLLLLSSAIYILSQEKISTEELKLADENLKKIVLDYEEVYGKTNMTMNVHCLLHLVECVKNLGPLWSHSMFHFESFNGTLAKYGKSPNNVTNQIVERVNLNFAVEKITEAPNRDVLFNEISVRLSISETIALRNKKISDSSKFFAAIKRGVTVFTSTTYTLAKKTADFFVSTKNHEYGKIKFYVKSGSEIYALIEEYSIEPSMHQICIAKTKSTNILRPTNEIVEKYILLKINFKEYVVKRPNKYEVN